MLTRPTSADEIFHQWAGNGLGQAEAGDGDAGGEALVVGEPKHQVLDRSQITDAQADAHDRAITDEHARQEVQGDAHARAGEADHEADHGYECGFLDVFLHHWPGKRGGHAEKKMASEKPHSTEAGLAGGRSAISRLNTLQQ